MQAKNRKKKEVLAMPASAMANHSSNASEAREVAKQLGITTTTLYEYVNGDGSLKPPGVALLGPEPEQRGSIFENIRRRWRRCLTPTASLLITHLFSITYRIKILPKRGRLPCPFCSFCSSRYTGCQGFPTVAFLSVFLHDTQYTTRC